MDGKTGEVLACVTDSSTTTIDQETTVTNEDMQKERCIEECKTAGFGCSDPNVGSNQLLWYFS